jgi:hypothetical protein
MNVGSLTSSGGGLRWRDNGSELWSIGRDVESPFSWFIETSFARSNRDAYYFLVARCGLGGPISGMSTASASNLTAGLINTSSTELLAGDADEEVE